MFMEKYEFGYLIEIEEKIKEISREIFIFTMDENFSKNCDLSGLYKKSILIQHKLSILERNILGREIAKRALE